MGVAALSAALRRLRGGPYPLLPAGEPPSITFPSSPLVTRVHIALGADLTASHLTWNWLDITERVRHDLGITLEAGRRDAYTQVSASRLQLKLTNDDGAFCRRNPNSPYFGLLTKNTPIWIELNPGSGFVDRYHGFVNEWPTRWTDPSGADCTVTIQCAGIMRRLAQGESLRSAMFRAVSGVAENDYQPHAYWAMEDGSAATRIASGIAGGPPAVVTGDVSFAAEPSLAGSQPLLTLDEGAVVIASIPTYADTGQWVIQGAFRIPSQPSGNIDIVEILTPDGYHNRHFITCQPGSPSYITLTNYVGSTSDGGVSLEFADDQESRIYGSWVMASIIYTQDGPDFDWVFDFYFLEDGEVIAGGGGGSGTGATGRPVAFYLKGGNGISFGHWAVFTDPRFDRFTDADANAAALTGFAGEQAHVRARRLCREERVPFVSQAVYSAAMGPQPVGTLLEVLRDCETADQGVLYEHQFGLAYQALSERYNQPVRLNLDFDSGHIAGVPEPADDDQRLINKFTAARRDGSSATVEKTTGTLGTGPGGSGVYDGSASVNVHTDNQLAPHAGWRVGLGTIDEDRWPRLAFQLHRPSNSTLIPAWLSTPFGARVNVTNPPAQMAPDTIDAIVEGYAEGWDQVAWGVSLDTSPASPYIIGVTDHATLAKTQTSGSTLAAEITTSDTSLTVNIAAGNPLWTTSPGNLQIIVGGEVMSVSAIAGGSSPQTFTVTRSANGVAKAHSAGAEVLVYRPARAGV